MSSPEQPLPPPPDGHPDPASAPASAPATAAGPDPAAERRRTHPITPLVTGWKIVIGIIAVLTAQNIARLANDFTITRALIGLGVIAAAVLVSVLFAALSWWFTTYAVDEGGVSLHKGMLSRTREYAPRARIESVSVERPLLARLLGLAKVRIEVAGGGESYLDIEYVRSADAEELRRGILGVAARTRTPEEERRDGGAPGAASGSVTASSVPGTGEEPARDGGDGAVSARDRLLYDGVTDGELIAQIPTGRLVRSLLRDLGFLAGIVMSIVGVAVAIALGFWQEGFSIAMIIALLPTLIAVPRYVFGRIESGWGFLSRITDRGLRMRRGLANTRTDNIASGRIQRIALRRPLLWRGPGWTAVTATVAGIEDDDENGAESVLPVGTREELRATLGHLAAPLGTADDLATLEHLLTAPAREIEGLRTSVGLFWISRRTRVSVLLPGALVVRRGVLTRSVEVIPRERLQQLRVGDGPLARRLGVLDLTIDVAGHSLNLDDLAREDVLRLHAVLTRDAATLRRYRDQERWPRPVLSPAAGRPAPPPVQGAPETAPPDEEERR
ncbi:PH domain-containing protein [Brachybacterium sp. YJGR34]|uniref:PH domain-containing protein n=1 Tax=Brachybacterium sp. YJGR34 TaxID=2059911 RepID=UPI000E0ACDEA|nr:PH domain-containing protein [Brachybacterium sp. YJGR34]